jgi:parvulin-like peptidyl-prolyl isomerase
MKKQFVAIAALAVASVSLSAQGTTTPQTSPQPTPTPTATMAPKGEILQKIIVKVNGEIFTQSELVFRQIQELREQQRMVRQASDLATDPALAAALSVITPNLLVKAVDELMLVQHGREIGVKFTDAIFKDALGQLMKANKIPDEATLQAALKQEGMSIADLRVSVERSFFVNEATRREIARNMTLTEEEARKYYNAHLDEFMKPATVTLREIVVNVPAETISGQVSFNVNADEAAKQKITAIRDRALKGEDFSKLVDEVSESGSKATGGVIGPVNTADLSEALGAMLAKMKPGDVTEPMRSRTGYQIIKLETRSDAVPETFEKSRERITQRVLESRLDVETTKLLEKLRVQAVIEWKDDACKKMYETARAARKTTPADGK